MMIFWGACSKNANDPLVEKSSHSESILIKKVHIFNGRDREIMSPKDVLIQDGIIKSISDEIEENPNQIVINGAGQTLMPGMVDAHVHLSGSGAVPWENHKADVIYNLQAYLYAGVTTVYDLGGLAGDISEFSDQIETGEILGPRVFNTHIPITVKNAHPIPLTEIMLPWPLKSMVNTISPTIDHVSEAPKLIEKYTSKEIDYVKIICDQIPPGSPEMNFEQLQALVAASHKAGKKVFVHIGSPENAMNAIKAGADVLAHGVWRGKLSEEQASFIARSNVPIIYTISGFKNVAHIHNGVFKPNELDQKLVPQEVLVPVTLEKGKDVHQQKVMNNFFKDVSAHSGYWEQNFTLLYQKGARILVGTDSNLPGTYAGSTYYQELDELKNFGMTNFEILTGATFLNAKLFLEHPDFGFVGVDMQADLLLIDGNPLEDLQLVKKPNLIIKSGEIIKRI